MWIVALLLLLVGFVFLFATGSNPTSALTTTLLTAPLVLFASYFMTRGSSKPSATEVRAAKAWVIIRRVVCFTASLVTGFIGVGMAYMGFKSSNYGLVGSGLFFCAIAFVAARVGMYGSETKHTLAGDRAAHEKRKQRYGWK